MALLKVRTHPDPVLREQCTPVDTFDEELVKLVQDMAETMYANDGVGLAAPQVGVTRRVIVLDTSPPEERGKAVLAIVNPEVITADGQIEWEEGCLSVPGMNVWVKRSAKVLVRGYNVKGEPIEVGGDELLAVALQHEIDHLNGVLLFDHASSLKRRFLLKDYLRSQESTSEEV